MIDFHVIDRVLSIGFRDPELVIFTDKNIILILSFFIYGVIILLEGHRRWKISLVWV